MIIRNIQPKARRAFTLIELLVVILIIAVLAAMIVPSYFRRVDDAKRAKAQDDISTISKVLHTFRLDCGRYPTTEEGFEALRTDPGDLPGWRGPYTDNPIGQDPWGGEYVYIYPGANGDDSFTLMSYGKDLAEGGDGDNEDIIYGGG